MLFVLCVRFFLYCFVYCFSPFSICVQCYRMVTQLQVINILFLLHVLRVYTIYLSQHNLKFSHLRNVCNVNTHENSFLQNSMVCIWSFVTYLILSDPSVALVTTIKWFTFRELPSSFSAFCEDVGVTNFVRVANTGVQNFAVKCHLHLKSLSWPPCWCYRYTNRTSQSSDH